MGRLLGGMVLPLPFHSLVLAFCHIVHLCYGCTTLATAAWQAMGLVYTSIVHIIPELAEEGCTTTLYMHGWSHTWFNRGTRCYILMRQGNGISGWPKDTPPRLVLGRMPVLVKA